MDKDEETPNSTLSLPPFVSDKFDAAQFRFKVNPAPEQQHMEEMKAEEDSFTSNSCHDPLDKHPTNNMEEEADDSNESDDGGDADDKEDNEKDADDAKAARNAEDSYNIDADNEEESESKDKEVNSEVDQALN